MPRSVRLRGGWAGTKQTQGHGPLFGLPEEREQPSLGSGGPAAQDDDLLHSAHGFLALAELVLDCTPERFQTGG
ncbi:hypothetical protein [Streptomyces decoyicus]